MSESPFMSFDDTRNLVKYLAKHTKYGKSLDHEDDFVVYHHFTKSLQKPFLRKEVLRYVATGKDFPTPREWGLFIGTAKDETLDDSAGYVLLMELSRAAQSGNDRELSEDARYVLRWSGTSFYDFKYNEKVRNKITVRTIIEAFKAKSQYEAKLAVLPVNDVPQLEGEAPKGMERWITPGGKEVQIYPQRTGSIKMVNPVSEKSSGFAQRYFDAVKKEKENE